MAEKTLVLEGLPDDLTHITAKLDLHFRNKRRSGGEIFEIREHPVDKRKALLVYLDDESLKKVLDKRIHKVDFKKSIGKVELQVKPQEDDGAKAKKIKPPLLPRPNLEKPALSEKPKHISGDKHHGLGSQEGLKKDEDTNRVSSLLVRSTGSVDSDVLSMYFEQFSEGIEITNHGMDSWILKLANLSDIQKILKTEKHDLGISVKEYKEAGAEGNWDPRRVVLSGFKESCKCNIISVFIGSCSQGAKHSLETLDDDDRIVVTFKQDIDIESFLKRCSSKKFKGVEIRACRLELTNSVLVQGDMKSVTEEMLMLYFTNKKRSRGGEIKSLIWINRNKSVVITFEDCHVAHQVVEQKHRLSGADLSGLLFYSSLQKALTEEMPSLSDIPTNVTISVSEDLIEYIKCNDVCKQEFQSHLKRVHASIPFNTITVPDQIILEMAVETESLAALRLGPTWESKARREAEAFLNKYSVVEMSIKADVWERVESSCLNLSTLDASVSHKRTSAKIVIVGLQSEVQTLVEKIKTMIKNANVELEVERNTIESEISLDSKEKLDFIWECVHTKLSNVEILKDGHSLTFHLKGLKDNVMTAEGVIKEMQKNVDAQPLDLSVPLMKFLKSLDLKKIERDHFAQNHISASFLEVENSLQILAERESIQKVVEKLREVLKEEVIRLTPDQANVIKGENWTQFYAKLQDDVDSSQNVRKVIILPSEEQIVICGFSSVVSDVSRKLKGYLENKTPATVDVPLTSVREVEFVDSCMRLSEAPEIKNLDVTILACRTHGFPCLKVTAANDKITKAVEVVKNRLAPIVMEKHKYSKAGESKVLEKHQANLKAKANDLKCKLYLSIEQTNRASQAFSHKIGGCVTVTIAEGDVSLHTADVLVCPMNGQLIFNNPIAQQFLHVGGPQIRDVCNKFQKEKQTFLSGDVVLSNPGHLHAKTLIYVVLSEWGRSGQRLDSLYLQSAILKSLQEAENRDSVSIAMPALGCKTFGCPVKESCMAMVEAVVQFCNNHQGTPKNIRHIFVVDSDVKIVEELHSLIEQLGYPSDMAGDISASSPPKNNVSQGPPPSVPPKPGSYTEATISGVSVFLKKGDITQETVDVIVNSNNRDLNLNSGVSGAILNAAGKSVVDECKTLGSQKADGVVLTSGGDLNCKHIAQMVGPNTAADITSSIKKVLHLCEGKMAATVSIPAIGTGRGTIGPEESIKAILTGLENHLSQTSPSCLKKIYIVAFEQKIFYSYRNYFSTRNKQSSSTSAHTTHANLPANQVKIGGVRIEVKRGDITNETVRGIVNTTNREMTLKGGVSGAIFQAAGNSVEQECQQIGPQAGDAAAVTRGGNLQCDFILHMVGPHSAAEARARVKKVLERCEENQITTVSFPAVGTGGGGLKGAEAIYAMLRGFEDHLSQCASTVLKLIYVVIDRDNILQEFLQGLKQWTPTSLDCDDDEIEDAYDGDAEEETEDEDSSDQSIASEEEDNSNTNTTEAIIGPMKVKVICGDITKETTDAIVSSTNTSLDLNSGVSGAILNAAGQTVMDECKALGTQPSDGVALTKAGNLKSKHIVHMVGQTKEKEITSSMYKALKKCEENKIQSVSFPATGTGAGNLAAAQVARAMIDAISNFSIDSPKCVTTVHIVIFQPKMVPDFEEALKKFKKITPMASASASTAKTPKQTHPKSSLAQSSLCLATATAGVTFPIMVAEVYGTSAADLVVVKKHLDELISEECSSTDVVSSQLAHLPEADKEAIVALSQSSQVHIVVAGPDKLTVSGKTDDTLAAILQIKTFIQEVRDRESRESEERRVRETLRWEVGEAEAWRALDSSISYKLEVAFHSKEPKLVYQDKGETYTVDLKKKTQTDSQGNTCRVKRTLLGDSDTAFIQQPPSWTEMGSKDLVIIALSPSSSEYTKIETEFLKSSKNPDPSAQAQNVQVVEIRRIQSQGQWQTYAVWKRTVDKKHPNKKNEQVLYHGTTKDICKKINKNNFNRSFCGRNVAHSTCPLCSEESMWSRATVHGNGTYFAKEAWYSCQDAYSNPDENGLKYIYRARVLTGSLCKSRGGMKEPDPLDPNDPQAGLHDCAVDNLQNPFIFVVFCDAGAYPEYLITFKTL